MDKKKKTFLVGFSGGADSTAALLWTVENCPGADVVAVHFNHHLRGSESDAEAAGAEKFAASRDIPFRLIDLDIAPGGNLEARARQARLESWQKLISEYDDPVVVTGHHRDDCIENMFLRIGRGSNVSGLTGLQKQALVSGVEFFRPLLNFDRAEIEEFLRERGVDSWATDSSNLECDYARNVLRNRILPELYRLFPGGKKAVEQSLNNLSDDALCLERMAQECYQDKRRFELSFWQRHDRALTVRMLKLLCREIFADDRPLTSGAIERFTAMVERGGSGICILDEARKVLFAGERIFPLRREMEFTVEWRWKDDPGVMLPGGWHLVAAVVETLPERCDEWEAFFDMDALPDVLTVASVQKGEKMVPFGRENQVSLKKLRTDAKIPSQLAPPVVKSGNEIIWFPGVRRSKWVPVGEKSRIIRFFMEKNVFLPGKNL